MTKKEFCLKYPPIAYYSGFSGLEIHGIVSGIDNYIYCVSGAWTASSKRKYHKLKIKYDGHGRKLLPNWEKIRKMSRCTASTAGRKRPYMWRRYKP